MLIESFTFVPTMGDLRANYGGRLFSLSRVGFVLLRYLFKSTYFLRITTIVHNLFFETFETVYSFFLSSSSSSSSRRKEILIQTNFQFSKMEQTKSHHFSINKFCPENDIALSRPQNFFYFFFFSQKRITQFLSLLLATAYKLQRLAPSAACSSVYLKNIFIGLEYVAAAASL